MKLLKYSAILIPLLFLSGCSFKGNSNPVTMDQQLVNDPTDIFSMKEKNFPMKVKANETKFNELIKEFNEKNPFKYVVINEIENDFVLKYDYDFKNLEEFIDYVNASLNRKITLARYSGLMYKITEKKEISIFDEDYLIDVGGLNFVDRPIQLLGDITHVDAIDMIEKDFNIPIIIKSNTPIEESPLNDKKLKDYQGTVKKLIQRIAIENKLFIRFHKGMVVLTDVDTKNFELKIPSLDLKTSGIFKDMTSVVLNPYDDLQQELETVLGDDAVININNSTGNILIKGNYDDLRQAQHIIKNFHDVYSKTISMDVYIYEVSLNRKNKFGVSFDSNMIKDFLGNSTYKLSTDFNLGSIATDTAASSVGFAQNFPVAEGAEAKFNKFFINFLNNFGNTRILTKPKLETINNIPVSMKITTSQDYVASIDETLSTDTGQTTSNTASSTNVTKETIETGFVLGLYPIAERNDKIKIIIKPVISQLLNITPYEYGSEESPKTIQLITKTEKDFSQIINMNNNEVAVISGYIYEKSIANKDTLPWMNPEEDSFLDPLTSAKTNERERIELIIAIKARIKE